MKNSGSCRRQEAPGSGKGMEQRETSLTARMGLVRFWSLDLLFIAGIPLIMERPNILQQSCWVFIRSLQDLGSECQEPLERREVIHRGEEKTS